MKNVLKFFAVCVILIGMSGAFAACGVDISANVNPNDGTKNGEVTVPVDNGDESENGGDETDGEVPDPTDDPEKENPDLTDGEDEIKGETPPAEDDGDGETSNPIGDDDADDESDDPDDNIDDGGNGGENTDPIDDDKNDEETNPNDGEENKDDQSGDPDDENKDPIGGGESGDDESDEDSESGENTKPNDDDDGQTPPTTPVPDGTTENPFIIDIDTTACEKTVSGVTRIIWKGTNPSGDLSIFTADGGLMVSVTQNAETVTPVPMDGMYVYFIPSLKTGEYIEIIYNGGVSISS